MNLQWARPRLLKAFPNQRIYAYFEVAPAPVDDREKEAQIIAALAAAGYRSSVEQVQELTGLEVTDTPPAPPAAMGGPVSNRAAAAAAAAPLTPQELAAFAGLATPNPARMEQRRAEVEARLRAAADLPAEEGAEVENKESIDDDGFVDVTALADEMDEAEPGDGEFVANSENHGCRAKDPKTCRIHGGFWNPAVLDPRNNNKTGTTAQELGLPLLSAITGDKLSAVVTTDRARTAMRSGQVKVRTMEGEWLNFDRETARHVEEDHNYYENKNDTLTNGQKRLQKLMDAVRAVRQPHEIWQELDENGKPIAKLYFRVYEAGDKTRVTLGVRWESETGRIHTYYDTTKNSSFNNKRKGRLLYKRDAELKK